MRTKTFLGCKIRDNQYDILEGVAVQFNETPCNKLEELHLETAKGLEGLEFQYNRVSRLCLPQSTPKLSVVRYHNNPLPQEVISRLQRDCQKSQIDALPLTLFERALLRKM